ncbi:MAG: ABC transporter permease [Chloroflexota bacterium]
MTAFLGRRLIEMVPVVVLVTAVSFGLIFVLPGDPAMLIIGDRSAGSPELYQSLRRDLGLDRPVHVQYLDWLGRMVQGDFGRSTRDREPIVNGLLIRLPITLELSALSLLLALVIALPSGIVAAVRPNGLWDTLGSLIALGGIAMPPFFLAILLIYGLAVSLHLLPPSGFERFSDSPGRNLLLMILPGITLGLGLAGPLMRQVRSGLLEVLGQEYVNTARAKGLPPRIVLLGHALRNALIPIITVIGLQVGRLLGGTVIVETMFGIPGIGRWAVDSILLRDFPVVQAVCLIMAVAVLLANLLADVIYAVVDPRIAYR